MSQTLGSHQVGAAWVHVAYTRNGNVHKVYLNGDLEISVTEAVLIDLPAVLLAYVNVIADSASPTLPRRSALTGLKVWTDILTTREIALEIAAGQNASRRTNLFTEAWMTSPTDLADHSGLKNDWSVDSVKSGTLLQSAGQGSRGGFPRFKLAGGWLGRNFAIGPTLTGATIGDAIGVMNVFAPTTISTLTIMGWFQVPVTAGPTRPVPLFRLAGDDAVGGTSEISVTVSTTGQLAFGLGILPQVSAGNSQIALMPIPSTVTLTGVVAAGGIFNTLTYQWNFVSGPYAPTIVSPTALVTAVTFSTFSAGTFVFELAVTFTNPRGQTVAVRAEVSVEIPAATSPTITSGSQQIVSPAVTTTLTPVVVDDGWSGALTYLWTQVSGPAGPVIATPTALSTLITVGGIPATYIFRIAVSNSRYTTYAYWRVPVLTGTTAAVNDTIRDTVLTIATVPYAMTVGSLSISEVPNELANTCQFELFTTTPPTLLQEAIVTLGGVRVFAGRLLRMDEKFLDLITNVAYDCHLIGYEWDFMRRRISKSYINMTGTAIALDLISMVPGFTTTYVDPDLPTVDELTFVNETIGSALTILARMVRGQWKVDYNKVVHVNVIETTSADPTPLTSNHPYFADLRISRDASQVANRVISEGGGSSAAADAAIGDTQVQVADLSWFEPNGGIARTGSQEFTYTGVKVVPVTPISSSIGLAGNSNSSGATSNSGVYDLITVVNNETGHEVDILPGIYTYFVTYLTIYGESTWVDTFNVNLQFAAYLIFGPPDFPAGVLRMNIYRNVGGQGAVTAAFPSPIDARLVGILSPQVSIIDNAQDGALASRASMPTVDNSQSSQQSSATSGIGSTTYQYFLTGTTLTEPIKNGDVINIRVEINDTAAQATLAAMLGGGDDGVVEAFISNGNVNGTEALALAEAYLAEHSVIDVGAAYSSFDQNSHPDGIISINLPAPVNLTGDFKIQQVDIDQFEKNVPTKYGVKAALLHSSLEKILAAIGADSSSSVNTGGSSSGGGTSALGIAGGTASRAISRPTYKKVAWIFPSSDTSGLFSAFGTTTNTAIGSQASFVDAIRGWVRESTAAAVSSQAGFVLGDNAMGYVEHLPFCELLFRTGSDITDIRFVFALGFNQITAPNDDLSLIKGFGIRFFSTAGDPGFVPWTSTGIAASQVVGTSSILRGGVKPSTIYRISFQVRNSSQFSATVNGSTQIMALPAAIGGTELNLSLKIVTNVPAVKFFDFAGYYFERN